MTQRIKNGFEVRVFGWFLWLNAYGFGVGRCWCGQEVCPWQFIVYRRGRSLVRG